MAARVGLMYGFIALAMAYSQRTSGREYMRAEPIIVETQ
jgi:hypothetical protein